MWRKDTKKKTNKEEDVERVADEIPSELGGEADVIGPKAIGSAITRELGRLSRSGPRDRARATKFNTLIHTHTSISTIMVLNLIK
eukprot:SAG11_NODE_2030_length_3899_cov_6.833772_1_plen_85_part_00